MTCKNGRVNPDQLTKYRLFGDASGRCQNPDCLEPLFRETPQGTKLHIAEAAHIVAANKGGARGESPLLEKDRARWENLILLCVTCHTTIDKVESDYPVDLLLQWKNTHIEKVEKALGIGKLHTRTEAAEQLHSFLRINKATFDTYGPESDYRSNPESEMASHWQRRVVDVIIPNNRSILRLVDRNRHLLTKHEFVTVEKFRIHVEDLEKRHLGDSPAVGGQQFPIEMNTLFTEIKDA